MSKTPGFASLLAFAHELADVSADVIRPQFRRPLAVANKAGKGGYDPVTAADQGAERAIRRAVKARYPSTASSARRWERARGRALPLGHRSHRRHARLHHGLADVGHAHRPARRIPSLLGLMNQPFTGERFWSGKTSAYMRIGDGKARRLKTRACPRMADAILSTTHPDLFGDGTEIEAFARLRSKARMTRYGGDCYAYCLLAAGFVDVIVESALKPYDVVALIPIIERAGGRVTEWTAARRPRRAHPRHRRQSPATMRCCGCSPADASPAFRRP